MKLEFLESEEAKKCEISCISGKLTSGAKQRAKETLRIYETIILVRIPNCWGKRKELKMWDG